MHSKLFPGIFLFGVLFAHTFVGAQQQQSQSANKEQQWKDPTTLRARVEKEKAKGLLKIVFPAPALE